MAFVALLGLSALGCGRTESRRAGPLAPSPNDALPGATSPDRLPPGELLEGEARAFGLPLPRDMTLDSITKHTAHVRGRVRPEALGEFLRARVLVQHVEMAEKKLVFPKAQVRGDPKGTILRLEIIDEGISTHLVVRNLMGPPAIEGLSEEERWRRAGMQPDGKLIDPQRLE